MDTLPPWHVGHVVWKLMLAHEPKEMQRGELAIRAKLRPMTVTHLLRTGRSEDDTIDAVAKVFGYTALELRQEADRANQRAEPSGMPKLRRATDRSQDEVDAEQYARRMMRLSEAAQNAIFMTIRAFESLLKRVNGET